MDRSIEFFIYHYYRLHEVFMPNPCLTKWNALLRANALCVALVFVLLYFLREINISRFVIVLWGIINLFLFVRRRLLSRRLLRYLRKRGL
jgi:FlaA1/EpsC-like NDP-sugar epimerase